MCPAGTARGRRAASTSGRGVLRAQTSPRGPTSASLGQTAPCRPTSRAAARRSHRRTPAGPGLPRRGSATAQGPLRAPLGVDVRRAGRRKRPNPAKMGPETARTNARENRLGALRPGLRRQRGANWVPIARWGVRLATSRHRARDRARRAAFTTRTHAHVDLDRMYLLVIEF